MAKHTHFDKSTQKGTASLDIQKKGVKRKRDAPDAVPNVHQMMQTPVSAAQPPKTSRTFGQNDTTGQKSNQNGHEIVPHHLRKKQADLLPFRKALPIRSQAQTIKTALQSSNVLVLTGETGSGKSTQVPQFLAEEKWCTKAIAITQPRRVAAISLAKRVAEEMGSLMGGQSPNAKVGYSVRFDHAAGPNTKIKYLTEGMLLQEMIRDPAMEQYSAVVVDEVHERSVNVDLILSFLKKLLDEGGKNGKKRKHPLKVVVMSATAEVESLVKFFEDTSRSTLGSVSLQSSGTNLENLNHTGAPSSSVSKCFVEGRQFPVKTIYLPQPVEDFIKAALERIFQIHYREALPGDILVFLPGQDMIEELEKLVLSYAEGMEKDVPKLLVQPLFAALPQDAQQRIFQKTPSRSRKVVLATNIAETSITVSGVRFVIDCGKAKLKFFRSGLGLETLLVKPISKSAAIQRQGRAGREAPGQCYRLYTEASYKDLEDVTKPEILRCDLSQTLLTMVARGIQDMGSFPWVTKPPRQALEKGLLQLLHTSCVDNVGGITEIGRTVAKFPLTPTLGRVMVEAAKPERDCLLDVIDIVSALSVENVFLNLVTEDRKEQAEEARRELYRREGDHLCLLLTVQRYAEEQSDRKAWCERHFVSHRAMQNVIKIRKQLRQQCLQLKLLLRDQEESSTPPSDTRSRMIHECILHGFLYNTARLMPDGGYETFIGRQRVHIHPSSVLFGRKTEGIVFNEFVFTGKAWAKNVSAVQLSWVSKVLDQFL